MWSPAWIRGRFIVDLDAIAIYQNAIDVPTFLASAAEPCVLTPGARR
mgnify:CR=1 FL=1